MAPEKVNRGIRGDPKRNVADQAPPVRFEGIGSELTSQTQSRVQVLIVHGPENHAVDHASPCAQERQSIPEGAIQRAWRDGLLSLAVGAGAFVRWRRIAPHAIPAGAIQGSAPLEPVASGPVAVGAVAKSPAGGIGVVAPVAQSTAPKTSAAFKPPKPNEVLSTRR